MAEWKRNGFMEEKQGAIRLSDETDLTRLLDKTT